MNLPRHKKYKDSGLEWIGAVPCHWEGPIALGAISSLKGRLGWQGLKADEYRDVGPYVVSSAHFSEFKIRWNECPRVSEERYEADGNIQLEAQDILLMKDGAAMGKIAFVDELPGKACLNSHLLLFRPLSPDGAGPTYAPKFVFYYMQTGLFQEYIKVNGTGATFLGIAQGAIAKHRVVWPGLAEQNVIAHFLDRETAKIDAMIADQEKLITLLAEKCQATISHAVTRGLNPNAQMKDSGVVALGEVPAHWGVMSLRRKILRIEQGWSPNAAAEPCVGNGWGVLKISAIKSGRFIAKENKALLDDTIPNESLRVLPGDLLITRANTAALVGDCCVVPPSSHARLILSDLIYRVKLKPDCSPHFFSYFLRSNFGRFQIKSDARGSSMTMAKISQGHISAWPVVVPPLKEQTAVVACLDIEVGKLDFLKKQAERAIALLEERRSALVTSAVTGQIDVRAVVAPSQTEEVTLVA